MIILRPDVIIVLLAVFVVLAPSTARSADNTRYVSISGNNANACTLAAPCRTLQRGINVTPDGGELRILDSGFYGNNANIKKSLTISGNGNTVYLGTEIVIDAVDAVVTLRELVLDGQGTIPVGVNIDAAKAVYIDRSVIRAYSSTGVFPEATGLIMRVRDSIFRNASSGIFGGSGLRLTVDNSQFSDHAASSGSAALYIDDGQAVVRNSTFAGNAQGIFNQGGAVTVASTTVFDSSTAGLTITFNGSMTIDSSAVRGSAIGLRVISGTARISSSSITENGTGINSGGTVETLGNNILKGNTTNLSGKALTPITGD